MPRAVPILVCAALALTACASEEPPETAASGPPRVRSDVVLAHAEQFDEEVPVRAPGSQEELIAASYILAHLQQAGFVPLLDAVPVGDLVESTNVVALPTESEPHTLVAVSYDAVPGTEQEGRAIGLFLELARALRAADPGHSVGFVALGAEHAEKLDGLLGTRRLLKYLEDAGLEPSIVTFAVAGDSDTVWAAGPDADDIVGLVEDGETREAPADDPFTASGLNHTVVGGPVDEVGDAMLEFLLDRTDKVAP